ncbi:SO_0444 family Cu/Zn efflux transporter [Bradyrhizobium sp. Arg237L]|nr:SO_0444 family Cu/Zn efflux transporter [Bradyrhizobium sp. Arg237L]MDI4234727.1 SO_0444 family Cu/Zn efflux transporter [Bradyrhizobium sp. Arg237L]
MIDFLFGVLRQTWEILEEASVFLLFGFLLAGTLGILVPGRLLTRLVGTGKIKSVLWGSVVGAPIPLCSCGVLPTALGLRKQGATPGATVAFLVATPETGVDSISLTYALTDPVMTVFRPIAGVATAIAAGLATNLFGVPRVTEPPLEVAKTPAAADEQCQHACDPTGHDHAHSHDHYDDHVQETNSPPDRGAGRTIFDTTRRIIRYGFVELLDDVSWWLALGIVLSGVVAFAIPAQLFEGVWGSGIASMVLMLLLSIPLYTCASCSTPMAAALALKGLSPGAVLVFLLAGPATNIGSLVVLLKILGRYAVAPYLVAVAIMTLAAGFALNAIYHAWGLDPRLTFGTAAGFVPDPVKEAGAVLLTGLLILSMFRTHVPNEWIWLRDRAAQLTGIAVTPRGLGFAAAAGAAVLWLGSGFFTVGPGEIGIRLRFGRILASDLEPGLHFRLPWPFEKHQLIAQNLARRLEFGLPRELSREEATRAQLRGRPAFGSFTLPQQAASGVWFQKETAPGDSFLPTGDANLIDLRSTAQYRIKDALAFAYNLAEPEALVRSTVLAALRSAIATRPIDAVYTTARAEIERETREAAQSMLDRYQAGIEVIAVSLLYDHPPEEVHNAFRDVASALEDKLRTINLANVFAVEKINQAKGEAAAMTEGALAFKEQRIAGAQAGADAFALRLEAYNRAPALTKFRLQLETLEDVLPGMRKFVRPGAGDVKDMDIWLLQPIGPGQSK